VQGFESVYRNNRGKGTVSEKDRRREDGETNAHASGRERAPPHKRVVVHHRQRPVANSIASIIAALASNLVGIASLACVVLGSANLPLGPLVSDRTWTSGKHCCQSSSSGRFGCLEGSRCCNRWTHLGYFRNTWLWRRHQRAFARTSPGISHVRSISSPSFARSFFDSFGLFAYVRTHQRR